MSSGLYRLEAIEIPFGVVFLVFHCIDPSLCGAVMQPRKHAVHVVVRALQQGLHSAIIQVTYPATHTLQMCMAHGSHPKAHALNTAADRYEYGFNVVLVMQSFNRCSPES